MLYNAKKVAAAPALDAGLDGPDWRDAPVIEITNYHPEASDHRPETRAKMVYTDDYIYVLYSVRDRYVRSIYTNYLDPVYLDSCVEFFIQPKPDKGYFNFEFNAGGAFLATYIIDPTRLPDGGIKQREKVDDALASLIVVYHSLPEVIEPEIQKPTEWQLGCAIPFAIFEPQVGRLGEIPGQEWRGNFYKCGDETSHPHWGSWSPIDLPKPNFHSPQFFGRIRFEG